MEKIISACFALAMIFSSCNNSTPAANPQLSSSQKKETGEKKNRDKDTAKILNDISVQTESGVEVDKAFLSYEDGSLVPSPNLTSLNKPIYLNLNIAKGWVEEMGESSR